MIKSKLRKIAIVLSALTVLSGSFGIDAAYARGGGGFGGGHLGGGFGGIHTGRIAQINGFGTSTAGGSGGTPTGPTDFTGIYGSSSAGGSGGLATGPTNFGTEGFGVSTAGGSGGRPTGSTEPILSQFGGTPSSNAVLENSGSGALAHGNVGGEQSVLGPSICVGC
jgi:hypothetical protein